jgi:hypothetical protein
MRQAGAGPSGQVLVAGYSKSPVMTHSQRTPGAVLAKKKKKRSYTVCSSGYAATDTS